MRSLEIGTIRNSLGLAVVFLAMIQWATSSGVLQTLHDQDASDDLRLNEIQLIGTHNSYHLAPQPKLLAMIGTAGKSVAEAIDYSHAPLEKQLSELGVRQLELDLYADPEGGLYRDPVGKKLLGADAWDSRMDFDFDREMITPGIKIIHAPGFDYATTVPTLKLALEQIIAWSHEHPGHLPIFVLLELKESVVGPAGVKPIAFDEDRLDALDEEIRNVVPASMLVTPDHVRGDKESLRDAIAGIGWPQLDALCGKIIFALDNTDGVRERYLQGHETLQGRILFVSVDESHPAAAWMKINDPVADFERIRRCVQQGFLVRTRADADTIQARSGDTSRRDRAFESGAQFISTDYPAPDPRWPEYQVRWPDNAIYRLNPIRTTPLKSQ